MPEPKSPETLNSNFCPDTANPIEFAKSAKSFFETNGINLSEITGLSNLTMGLRKLKGVFDSLKNNENTNTIKDIKDAIVKSFENSFEYKTKSQLQQIFAQNCLKLIKPLLEKEDQKGSSPEQIEEQAQKQFVEQFEPIGDGLSMLYEFLKTSFSDSTTKDIAKDLLLQVLEQIDAE